VRPALALLALCAALWAAGHLVVGGVVAPTVFAQADAGAFPRAIAGQVVGEVLWRWSGWALVPWALALAALVRLATACWAGRRRLGLGLCLAGMLLALPLRPLSHALVAEGRTLAADLRAGAGDDARQRFRRLHGLSMACGLAETAVAAALAVAAAAALTRLSGPSAPARPL
jgi:hypothetical protein